MTKTIKTGIVAIAIMVTLLAGYAVGFTQCQQQWEQKIMSQIK
jgi:hypothetical protein